MTTDDLTMWAAWPTGEEDDPYADARPPDGACYCNGCIGMGPCDDDLGRADCEGYADEDDWEEPE